MLLGVNVDVVAEEESMELTVPATEFPDESARVNVLVVMVEVSINSLKVAEMLETTVAAPSDGEVEETVGAVVSVVVVLSVVPVVECSSFSSLQEVMVRLKQEIRIMNKTFFICSSIQKVKYYWFV